MIISKINEKGSYLLNFKKNNNKQTIVNIIDKMI